MQETIIEDNGRVVKNVGVAEGADAEKKKDNCSAVPPKFKDVNALAEAYNSLQAEFTRRCQRLKELESRVKEFSKELPDEADNRLAFSDDRGARATKKSVFFAKNGKNAESAEGERTSANSESETKRAVPETTTTEPVTVSEVSEKVSNSNPPTMTFEHKFEKEKAIEDYDVSKDFGGAESRNTAVVPQECEDVKEKLKVSEGVAAEPRSVCEETRVSEEVRLKIIGEYLDSLRKNAAPLVRGGAGTFGTPPMRANSLEEAGVMALRVFKKA